MKGMFHNLIYLTLLMFFSGFLWMVMSIPYEQGIFPAYDSWTENTDVNHTRADTTAERIKTGWYAWPVAIAIFIVIALIASALRREPGGYGY